MPKAYDLSLSTQRRPAPSEAEALRQAELTSVRAWARSRGYPIDETAGVPPAVLRTYRKVHAC